jgi:signal transduction histidine kinase
LVSLINVSASLGDIEKTAHYTKRLVHFHKTQEERNVDETLASLETEYLLKEQKLENRALKAESEQAKLELSRNKAILIGLVVGLILLIALVIVAVAFYRRVKAFNQELEIKVAEKTEEVVQRNAKLRETSIALAHELRSRVSTLLGAKSLLDEKGIPEELDKELYEAIGYSTEKMDVTIKALIQRLDEDQAKNGKG